MKRIVHAHFDSFLRLPLLGVVFSLFTCYKSSAQIPIQYYDFESNVSRTTFESTYEAAINTTNVTAVTRILNNSSATLSSVSGAGQFNGNSGSNLGQAASGTGWQNVDSDPGNSATHYFQFTVNTTGFSGITINFDQQRSANGPGNCNIMYSTGGAYTAFNTAATTTPNNNVSNSDLSWGNLTFDLSGISSIDNQSSVTFRIYAYKGINTVSSGTFRIDNLEIRANATTTSAGIVNLLAESNLYTCFTSGLTGSLRTRGGFTVTGSGTTVNVGSGGLTSNGTITVTNGGTFNTSSIALVSNGAILVNSNGILNLGSGIVTTGSITIDNTGTLNAGTQTVSSSGSFTLASGGKLTTAHASGVSGSITCTNKTFAAGADYEFNGTIAQNTGFSGLTIGNPRNITVSNTFGNITQTNGTTPNTMTVSGTITVISGTTFSIPNGNHFSNSGGSLVINGTVLIDDVNGFSGPSAGPAFVGFGSNITFGANGTVNYIGHAAQAITNEVNYNNLTLSTTITTSVNKTLNGNITINKNLTVTGSAVLVAGSNTITLGGDWNVNSTGSFSGFNDGTSTVTLNGSGSQSIYTNGGEEFYNLIIAGSGTKTLQSDLKISSNGSLTINSATLDVGTYTLNTTTSNKGTLTMTGGTLRLAKTGTTVPEIDGTYNLTGGIVELYGSGNQTLRGGSGRSYYNLLFSGNASVKISGAITTIVSVTIQNTATLDVENNSFGTTGRIIVNDVTTPVNFTMTGGRFRTSGSSTQPDMAGTWTLSGGTFELYGSNSQSLRAPRTYYNVEINGSNVGHGGGTITIPTGGTFTIKSGGVYRMTDNPIAGAGTFVMEANATLNYGFTSGITLGSGTGTANGIIRVTGGGGRNNTTTFPPTANYGLIGTGTGAISAGDGLPSTVNNFTVSNVSNTSPPVINTSTLTNNLTVNGTLTLSTPLTLNGKTLNIAGSVTGTSNLIGSSESGLTISGTNGGNAGTISFGSSNNVLKKLTIDRSGTSGSATLGSSLTVSQLDLLNGTLNNASNLTLSATPPANIFINKTNGNLSSEPNYGASVDLTYNQSDAPITTGIEFSSNPSVINRITINSTNGVQLHAPRTINSTLQFTSGKLDINSYDLTIPSTATITGTSASNYIVAEGSGYLIRTNITNEALFPVGTSTSYSPASLANASANGAKDFKVNVKDKICENGTTTCTSEISAGAVRKMWNIEKITSGEADATLKLGWTSGAELTGFNRANPITISRFNGVIWDQITTSNVTPITGTIATVQISNRSQFSPHAVNNQASPLPVTLVTFTGKLLTDMVELKWSTATEINNKGFEIQRSLDGMAFTTVGYVDGAGNSSQTQQYKFIVIHQAGAYYRLKQLDLDGKHNFSRTIFISNNSQQVGLQFGLFPNPINDVVKLNLTGKVDEQAKFSVRLSTGSGLSQGHFTGDIHEINTWLAARAPVLQKGLYILNVTGSGHSQYLKFVKQ